mmetsp:Transcript_50375/g.155755  ORF Transcript_50375/g.155755 Transcript_50375/m.155755 type:complete len:93 (-) Transcript_50375:1418-1696(-)
MRSLLRKEARGRNTPCCLFCQAHQLAHFPDVSDAAATLTPAHPTSFKVKTTSWASVLLVPQNSFHADCAGSKCISWLACCLQRQVGYLPAES